MRGSLDFHFDFHFAVRVSGEFAGRRLADAVSEGMPMAVDVAWYKRTQSHGYSRKFIALHSFTHKSQNLVGIHNICVLKI